MSRNNNEKEELRKSIERKSEQSQSLSDFDLFELIAATDPRNIGAFIEILTSNGIDVDELLARSENKMASSRVSLGEVQQDIMNDDFEELDPFQLPNRVFFEDETVYACHIRIKLNGAPLPIWREVEVPSNISLAFFAHVVLEAMGWDNSHLHQFKYGNKIFKNRACIEKDDEMFLGLLLCRTEVCDTEDYSVSMIFKEKGKRVRFEYDFGDGWEHDIWLKKIREYGPDEAPCIKILKGVGTCPPEDCGGIWGYENILEIWGKKRKTTEERELLEWSGIEKDFDPEYFDIERVRECLCDLWESVL